MGVLLRDLAIEDENQTTIKLTGNKETLIRYFSTARVYFYAISTSGTINTDTVLIRHGNQLGFGWTAAFSNVENNIFIVSAEDEEGNYGSWSVGASSWVDYVKLTCNAGNNRPDASGNMTVSCTGAYFNGSFGERYNSLSVQYHYRASGGSWSGWYTMSTSLNGNAYYAYSTLSGLNYQTSYDFEFVATDALMSVSSSASGVKSTPVFHWGENDVVFEVPATFNGGIVGMESGTWTPTFDTGGAVISYDEQYGWYTKIGNVVTIGFYVSAQCNDGYQNYNPSINGFKYSGSVPAAGCGFAHGAYSYSINESVGFLMYGGTIYAISQDRDSSNDRNLTYSANYIGFPSGGGQLILYGTITYMV